MILLLETVHGILFLDHKGNLWWVQGGYTKLSGQLTGVWRSTRQDVSRGFSQIEGIDYEETFAPVARYASIQTILALSVQMGWHIHQLDVKTAFLNGVIEEEVYIEQPEGFEVFSSESHVCKLNRALCGLKQAPRACTHGYIAISQDLDSPRARRILTYTRLWWRVSFLSLYCMLMISF